MSRAAAGLGLRPLVLKYRFSIFMRIKKELFVRMLVLAFNHDRRLYEGDDPIAFADQVITKDFMGTYIKGNYIILHVTGGKGICWGYDYINLLNLSSYKGLWRIIRWFKNDLFRLYEYNKALGLYEEGEE